MASLLVVTGPPGAGKSTIAALVARRSTPSVLVEGDAFFAFLDQGAIPPWLPESDAQNTVVTRAAAAATGRFSESYTTIYDGVIGPWFIDTFALETGLSNLDYAILMPSVETCVERVRTRQGHGFSDEAATQDAPRVQPRAGRRSSRHTRAAEHPRGGRRRGPRSPCRRDPHLSATEPLSFSDRAAVMASYECRYRFSAGAPARPSA